MNFMLSGGYDVTGQIEQVGQNSATSTSLLITVKKNEVLKRHFWTQVKQNTLLICSEKDNIVSNKLTEVRSVPFFLQSFHFLMASNSCETVNPEIAERAA